MRMRMRIEAFSPEFLQSENENAAAALLVSCLNEMYFCVQFFRAEESELSLSRIMMEKKERKVKIMHEGR